MNKNKVYLHLNFYLTSPLLYTSFDNPFVFPLDIIHVMEGGSIN